MTHQTPGSAASLNAADLILGPSLAQGRQDAVALLFGEERITFAELDAQASRVGNALQPHIAVGDRVLMLLKDSPTFVAAFLGIMRAGGVSVPMNTRLAPKDLAFAIADSEAAVLLIDDEFLPLLDKAREAGAPSPRLVAVNGTAPSGMADFGALVAAASPHLKSVPMAADDMAFWLYTSGTTGSPKGAIHCHGDVPVGDSYMEMLGLGPGERVFASSKMFFAFSLGHTLLGGLRSGATVIVYEGWPDSNSIAEVVDRYRPTVMLSVPTFFRNLLRDGLAARAGFKGVRTYLSAGEALPESIYHRWREETGVPIIQGIGATETIFMFISGTPADHNPAATGKPMPYAEVTLLDEQERPVTEVDAPGVVWTRLGSLCRGYWKQPDKTQAAFRDGWFRTGDVFSVDAKGWWYHQGRGDDLLKISGQWVSPGEIEECAAAVPGVLEAAAVGAENEDGLVRTTLFLVASDEAGDVAATVRERLLANLSVYKCPRNIHLVEEIPRTATGKIQRFRLRQLAQELNAGG